MPTSLQQYYYRTTEAIFGMRLPRAYNGEEAYVTGQGLRTLALDTSAANTAAPAFYGRMGYAEESVKLVTAVRK